ncbi:MAG: protein kinase, partial [Syntrophaceae bacterium]|nr:protein kinase [Syntrophaceae bacterium]
MEKIGNYILREKILETKNSIIYRGHKKNASQPLIIKCLKTTHSTPSEIARFRQEYERIKKLDIKGVIKTFDVLHYKEGFVLCQEDFVGIPIKHHLEKKEILDLKSFLKISANITDALGNIHASGIIHRAISPNNILISPTTEEIRITNFGISAIITHENDEVYNPDFIN